MSDNDYLYKLMFRFGIMGFLMFTASASTAFTLWLYASARYTWPLGIPILVSVWMLWVIKKEKHNE